MTKRKKIRPVISAQDLRIDRSSLDAEIIKQPELIYHAGMLVARTISLRDAVRDSIKTTEAELRIALRKKAEKRSARFSETKLAEEVDGHPTMRELKGSYTRAIHRANKAEALYEAMKARGYALRELAQMEHDQLAAKGFILTDQEADTRRRQMDRQRRTQE